MYDNYQGITPAHAGKRPEYTFITSLYEDHPRTRGEKRLCQVSLSGAVGSPPHTRGKVNPSVDNIDKQGITPAHAGKSIVERETFGMYEDHPRTRGEKKLCQVSLSGAAGSPPHTRGKVQEIQKSLNPDGITPAHAGKRIQKSLNPNVD